MRKTFGFLLRTQVASNQDNCCIRFPIIQHNSFLKEMRRSYRWKCMTALQMRVVIFDTTEKVVDP